MKNKLLIVLALVMIAASCVENRLEVIIPMQKSDILDFEKYDRVLVTDFSLSLTPQSIKLDPSPLDFFTNDFGRFIDKDIEYVKLEPLEKLEPENLKQKLAQYPNALLITGRLAVEMKERSKIREEKDKFGDKTKSFVKLQNWSMNVGIQLLDTSSGRVIRNYDFKERLSESENPEEKFNYRTMFDRITDRFLRRVTKQRVYERRYLLWD